MKEKILELKGIKKSYPSGTLLLGKTEVLKGINLNVFKGEIYSLLGHNGAGKTTTFKIITGISKQDEGDVLFKGKKFSLKDKRQIGFLPERPYFYEYLTGREFLEFSANLFGIKADKKKIDALLELVELKEAENRQLKKYSKGMLQRLGIAQSIINDPELIILDEPLSGLDPIGRKKLRDIILGLKEEGRTIIYSSHILQDAEIISDRIGIIVKGKTVMEGSLEELVSGEVREVEVGIYGLNSLPEDINYLKSEKKANVFYVTVKDIDEANILIEKVMDSGGKIKFCNPIRKSLEELFWEIKDENNSNS